MNILIIGNGGREHTLLRQIEKYSFNHTSNKYRIYTVPGNGGSAIGGHNLPIDIDLTPPFTDLIKTAIDKQIDLVVVGPENYLSAGLSDALNSAGIGVFGPSQEASRLESSKTFAKKVMKSAGVSTADYREFHDFQEAEDFLKKEFRNGQRWVLKADGLCAGKGVIVPKGIEEALDGLKGYFIDKNFGSAGEKVIIEEFMDGEEVSVLAFSDGKTVRLLPASQDHKRIYDGDKGPNTGGMGVYTPVPVFRPGFEDRVEKEILLPILQEMERRGTPYQGILYAGLMVKGNSIRVVEFNVRFGDPECQCVLPLLDYNPVEVFQACIEKRLDQIDFRVNPFPAVCVVIASGGYPGRYQVGKEIFGLEKIPSSSKETGLRFEVYHAGTKHKEGKFFTSGGRVLSVCAYAENHHTSLEKTISSCYEQVNKIKFEDSYYRKDIGFKGIRV